MSKKFFTPKKIILFSVSISLIVVVFYVTNLLNKPNIGRIVEPDGTHILSSGTIRNEGFSDENLFQDNVSTSCFSYSLSHQYSPKVEEELGKCVVRSGLFDPKGQLTVSWQQMQPDVIFTENTGIQLREKNIKLYSPVTIEVDQFDHYLTFDGDQETTMFIEAKDGIIVVSLHNFLGSENERHDIVRQVVDSIDLL